MPNKRKPNDSPTPEQTNAFDEGLFVLETAARGSLHYHSMAFIHVFGYCRKYLRKQCKCKFGMHSHTVACYNSDDYYTSNDDDTMPDLV